MLTQVVERHEMRRVCGAVHEDDPADLGLQVLLEGLFLDDPAEAQRCLASFAYQHLAEAPFTSRVSRLRDGDWTVEIAGENGRWLTMRPVTRDCADIDAVHWDVVVRNALGDPIGIDDTAGRPRETSARGPLVREHLGFDPSLVDDLVDIALSTPGLERHFRIAVPSRERSDRE